LPALALLAFDEPRPFPAFLATEFLATFFEPRVAFRDFEPRPAASA
jgi:hypothetical protein